MESASRTAIIVISYGEIAPMERMRLAVIMILILLSFEFVKIKTSMQPTKLNIGLNNP